MSNRRSFLQRLIGATAALVAAPVIAKAIQTEQPKARTLVLGKDRLYAIDTAANSGGIMGEGSLTGRDERLAFRDRQYREVFQWTREESQRILNEHASSALHAIHKAQRS